MTEENKTSSDETTAANTPRRRVLELQEVTFGTRPETSLCLKDSSWAVHRGDLVMIRTHSSQKTRRFASMLQGLVQPAAGTVRFNGRDWAKQRIQTQLTMRSRMGRVFDERGWVANLNVRENVLLAKQHHGADSSEVEKQLAFWCDWFEIGNVTRTRPSVMESSQLQIHQWIRAYLGPPTLVILERPMRAVSSNLFERFVASLHHMRSLRAAVIWIAGSTMGDALDSISPDWCLDLRPGERGRT